MNICSKYYVDCEDKIFKGKKNGSIPKLWEYREVLNTSLTLNELKILKKEYNIKGIYKKKELLKILYNKMRIKYNLQLIIRYYMSYKLETYLKLLGNNGNYVNTEDFESLEPLCSIDKHDLMELEEDNKIYGFDILSFENLLLKYKDNAFNPYTRKILNQDVRDRFKKIIFMKRLFKYGTRINQKQIVKDNIEDRLENIFYDINRLGNYADSTWIYELPKHSLIKFIYELMDIWEYRANLTNETKRNIYIHMNPFSDIRLSRLMNDTEIILKEKIIRIIERLISSEEQEHASLGAFYVLGALTLVNVNAAEALPWLFQSFYHVNM